MSDIKDKIERASSVAIVVPEHATDENYLAALNLKRAAGTKAFIIGGGDVRQAWDDTFGHEPQLKEFAIVVDTSETPIEGLRYEKHENSLRILLSHHNSLSSDAVYFEESVPKCDLVITLGFASKRDTDTAISALPKENGWEHLSLDREDAPKINSGSAGLLGRILVRSRKEEALDTLWSFITRNDFIKSNSGPEQVPPIINILPNIIKVPRFVCVLWQSASNDIRGIVWSQDNNHLRQIAAFYHQEPVNNYIVLPSATNFAEAEIALRKLMKNVH